MYNGADDINKLGRLTAWNYSNRTNYYPGSCGIINGTIGELFYPVLDDEEVTVFSPDICRFVRKILLLRNITIT